MVRRDYSGMTLITPDSPNYNRGVLYGVLNAGIEEIPAKDMKLEDLKDVKISESEVEVKIFSCIIKRMKHGKIRIWISIWKITW